MSTQALEATGHLLNQLSPAKGSKRPARRVGRGMGSGLGKTCGKGHKGQKSRSGCKLGPGFEGGQMPIHRRLPKQGFKSRANRHTMRLRVGTLASIPEDKLGQVDLLLLKQLGLVRQDTRDVKFYLSGECERAVTLVGLKVTRGVRALIESHGGKVLD